MQNINTKFEKVEEKMGFLSKFLDPIMKMLGDREFFHTPLKVFYYIIALSNLLLPIVMIGGCSYIFYLGVRFNLLEFWDYITLPVFFLVIIVLSAIIGVGSYAFWVRRMADIISYNQHSHTYMAVRNFGLFFRTMGEWTGLFIMFMGVLCFIIIPVPEPLLDKVNFAMSIPESIVMAITCFFFGYLTIFLAKVFNDWTQGFAAKADNLRDLADIERAKAEIDSLN